MLRERLGEQFAAALRTCFPSSARVATPPVVIADHPSRRRPRFDPRRVVFRFFARGRRFEPDRELDRRGRRAGRFAGTFLLGSGLTAGPWMTVPSALNIDP